MSATIGEVKEFQVPGIESEVIAFQVEGNSMMPTITAGDMILCSNVEDINQIRDHEIYAVLTEDAVWVKRVIRHIQNGTLTHLQLCSDNASEYADFLLHINEVKRLLKVNRKLSPLMSRK